jgi:hypothetical protein
MALWLALAITLALALALALAIKGKDILNAFVDGDGGCVILEVGKKKKIMSVI